MTNAVRILVVDDEASVSSSVVALLRQRNYQAVACATVEQARDILSGDEHYDLALIDVRLQEEDGRSILDYAGKHAPQTQCLIMSGENAIDIAIDALRRGARDYIRKPFSPDELFHRISAALDTSKLRQENSEYQKKIESSEALHRFLVQNSPDLIFILNEEGRLTYANNRFLDTLGYSATSAQGLSLQELAAPSDEPKARHLLDRSSNPKAEYGSCELRLRNVRGGDEGHIYDVTLMSMRSYVRGRNQVNGAQFEGFYGLARDITDQKQAEAVIAFQATHDMLTRLPNRALFQDRMAATIRLASRDKHGCAVFFIDVDRFKSINDTLGHGVGDELLRQVTDRMRDLLRDSDTLARVGGDEFMVLLPHIDQIEHTEIVAKKICEVLKQPFSIDGHEIFVTASIGIAQYPEHGTQMEELIRHADIAMYEVKNANRDGYRFFSDDLGDITSERFIMAQQLRNAVEGNQLRVHYQPQVDVSTGQTMCLEALVRWEHPKLGLLHPGDFIQIAEESGLILEIDRWVLRSSCADLRKWRDAGAKNMRVAVNFSVQQFADNELVPFVLSTLGEFDVPGSNLEIEITETGILRDLQSVTGKFLELAEHGVKVALDDFGAGYTSLSYLRSLPVNTVKIDRSFVRDVANGSVDSSIVKAIVNMAHGLHMKPIAEGVESREQAEFLASMGCSDMQGFYFSRPIPPEQVQALWQKLQPTLN